MLHKLENLSAIFAVIAVLGISQTISGPARADDEKHVYPVAGVLNTPDAKEKLDGSVSFYFGNTKHPAVKTNFGETVTNKKTNGFAKSDHEACMHVMLSALIALQEEAKSQGANAVINIHSYFKKNDVSYDDKFECYSGFLMSGVALKGDIVKLAR